MGTRIETWYFLQVVSTSKLTAVLTGALLCVAGGWSKAQSVTFSGAPIALPVSGLVNPAGLAIDGAGDIYVAEPSLNEVVVLFKTLTGYAPPTKVPITGYYGLNSPYGVALDSAGDTFVADTVNSQVLKGSPETGYPANPLPFSGLSYPYGIAVDAAGDVFVTEPLLNKVVELKRTPTAYGSQSTLLTEGLNNPDGIAVDSAGNLFIADTGNNRIVELPKTDTGYGLQNTLPLNDLYFPFGVAISLGGNVFVSDTYNNRVVKLSKTPTGYGTQIPLPAGNLPASLSYPEGIAADPSGNVFISDTGNNRIVELQGRTVNFGNVNVCAPEPTEPAPCNQLLVLGFRIKTDVTLGAPLVLNGKTADFAVASGSTCTGELKEGASCFVKVNLAPKAAGFRQGTTEIVDTRGAVLATVPLTGFGIAPNAPPVARFSTTFMQFGTVVSGNTKTLPLTISNVGGGVLPIYPLVNGRSFKIVGSTCGIGLAAGESCTLHVEFAAITAAAHHNTLTLQTNGPAFPAVYLEGFAPGLIVSSHQLKFGSIPSGTTKVLPLTVTSFGLHVAVTATAYVLNGYLSPFHVLNTSQNTCTSAITVGQSCVLPIEFAPSKPGKYNGEVLKIYSVAGSRGGLTANEVFLDGTGTE